MPLVSNPGSTALVHRLAWRPNYRAGRHRLDLAHGLLLALMVWVFARAYYFAFYVIEKYVDPTYRFSGLGSFFRHCLRRRR